MKVGLYPRVSSAEQAENYSIGEQIDKMTKYCQSKDWIIYNIYTDPGYSGTNMDRPGLQKLIADVKSHNLDVVLVYRLDRLSRSQADTITLIEQVFLPNNVDFVSMSENFDTTSPFGRAMIGILSAFSQLELERIKDRMKDGKAGRAKEGLFHGGVAPIGYEYDPYTGKLTISEYEAMCVRDAYELYLAGTSIRGIEEIFRTRGHTHKYGEWTDVAIRNVLRNPVYAGYIQHNGTLYEGQHTPIVSRSDYELMQENIAKNAPKRKLIKDRKYTTYLGGLLYCAQCGGKYHKRMGKKGKNKSAPIYYVCYSRDKRARRMVKDPNCKNKVWRADELDGIIFDQIKQLVIDPEYLDSLRESKPDNSDKINILRSEITKIDDRISKLMDLYTYGKIDVETISDKIDQLTASKNALNNQLDDLAATDESLDVEAAIELASSFENLLNAGSFDDIRGIIEALIQKIELDGDDITIYWNFSSNEI